MTFDTTDRVTATPDARVFDGLNNEWLPLGGQPGTIQAMHGGYAWTIFDDDAIHERFGPIPMYPARLVPS